MAVPFFYGKYMKKFVFCISLIFSVVLLFAENSFFEGKGGKNHTIMFASSTLENGIFDKSDEWLCEKVKYNLISALSRFGGFSCVDMAQAKNIVKVQKELESGLYDETQSIEIGKMIKAKEVINIVTTRLSSGSYSMTVTLFNVETGQILGMFSSPKTYESSESYAIQAHYECVTFLLNQLDVKQTAEGKRVLASEMNTARMQVETNKRVATENAKKEEERSERAAEQAKIAAEAKAKKQAQEKAEYEAAQKVLAEKKAKEAAAAAKAKQQNPLAKETYTTKVKSGSRQDVYTIKFTSQNACTVTVNSTNSKGVTSSFTADGNYTYQNEMLSISVQMQNQNVKHVQKINWKGAVTFKNGYNTFYMLIPVSSKADAEKIRAEFQLK